MSSTDLVVGGGGGGAEEVEGDEGGSAGGGGGRLRSAFALSNSALVGVLTSIFVFGS